MHTTVTPVSPRCFADIVEIATSLSTDVLAKHADEVDQQARFPAEALRAFKDHRLLSILVPQDLGGDGLSIAQCCKICEVLGRGCASTAMIFAMHQIQVACLVRHAGSANDLGGFLANLSRQQLLIASATTELQSGGDISTSHCALLMHGDAFEVTKAAPVISYADHADAIALTARANEDSANSDQVLALIHKADYQLEQQSGWDTLGFRGTCSNGYLLTGSGKAEQILADRFDRILSQTMQPVSHLLWASLWIGLADNALGIARKSVQRKARKNPGATSMAALRLTEADELLFSMRSGVDQVRDEYQLMLDRGDFSAIASMRFTIRINNVKLRCSEMVVDIVSAALMIVGISGYRNDSADSVGRQLRDAYGAALMVNNDRIRSDNATFQLAVKSGS